MIEPQGYPNFEIDIPDAAMVEISTRKFNKIVKFAKELAKKKMEEAHYKVDCASLEKRLITGLIGEAAVETLLGVRVTDWTIGDSTDYNKPDLRKYGVGVKCVEFGLHPLVSVDPKYSEIICIRTDEKRVAVCGLATVDVLKQYQSTKLIKAKGVKMRKVKSGFFGFNKLKPFSTLKELEIILNDIK